MVYIAWTGLALVLWPFALLPAWIQGHAVPEPASYRWPNPLAPTHQEVEWGVCFFGAGQTLEWDLSLLLGLIPAAGTRYLSRLALLGWEAQIKKTATCP